MQAYVKKILNWRNQNPVIASGKTLHFAPFEGLYVYFRYDKKKTIMVILSKKNKEIILQTDRFAEILAGKIKAQNVVTAEQINLQQGISVKPTAATILEIIN